MESFDVLIVGAGAAGVAAAAALAHRGRTVCVLEARDRVGGRILTRHEPDFAVPLELGAEFIHGYAPSTLALLQRSRTPVTSCPRSRWILQDGRLQASKDLFAELRHALDSVPRPECDMAFGDFLEGPACAEISGPAKRLARMLVEGFDAADPSQVSALDTLAAWHGESAADAPAFRPQQGYGSLIRAMSGALDPDKVQLRLQTVVSEVRWRRGSVTILGMQHGQPVRAVAPRAVITLPVSVLQLTSGSPHAVRFVPELTAKRAALSKLAAGPAIKVLLRFREPFWEKIDGGQYRDAAFFQAPAAIFRTFWTSLPGRAPLLSAWTAGPNASSLSGSKVADVIGAALDSAQALFGERAGVRSRLQAAYLHDWQTDPFALGAYSYVLVGGMAARRSLATPIEETLFFAGEATDTTGWSATVEGALQSASRAVGELLSSSSQPA